MESPEKEKPPFTLTPEQEMFIQTLGDTLDSYVTAAENKEDTEDLELMLERFSALDEQWCIYSKREILFILDI